MTTNKTQRLIPIGGLSVRDPATGNPLPPEGADIPLPLSNYWRRRVADGSVTNQKPAAAKTRAGKTNATAPE
jgi:hypothetical protein